MGPSPASAANTDPDAVDVARLATGSSSDAAGLFNTLALAGRLYTRLGIAL